MKKILFLFILSNASCFHSQSFTNGSVYDYNVGDTIVTSVQNYNDMYFNPSYGPPTFTYRVFTSKHFSAAHDTVFYTAHDVVMTYKPDLTMTISANNISFVITDLTSSATNFSIQWLGACQAIKDTSYVNGCGLHEYSSNAVIITDSLCTEPPPIIENKVIEGVGVFEYRRYPTGIPTFYGYKEDLVWFRKGNKRCGAATAIPDGIPEWTTVNNKLNVYPNPSNGICTVEVNKEGTLSVESISGNDVYTSVVSQGKSQIDLTHLPSGIYFIKCRNEDGVYRARVVIEH